MTASFKPQSTESEFHFRGAQREAFFAQWPLIMSIIAGVISFLSSRPELNTENRRFSTDTENIWSISKSTPVTIKAIWSRKRKKKRSPKRIFNKLELENFLPEKKRTSLHEMEIHNFLLHKHCVETLCKQKFSGEILLHHRW